MVAEGEGEGESPTTADRSLATSRQRAVVPARRLSGFGRFLQFLGIASDESHEPETPPLQLTVVGLQAELQEVDREISGTMASLAELETAEREAIRTRDKLALDVAWQSREREATRLLELEQRRAIIRDNLAQRFQPEMESWRQRCEAAVTRWRTEDREQVETIEQSLRQAEALIWTLSQREKRRAEEQDALEREFDVLVEKAPSLSLTQPKVDWSTEPISLRDITTRLESIQQLLDEFNAQRPAGIQ
jgi:chromosome segregation ATPase